jgi:hypothetical protein
MLNRPSVLVALGILMIASALATDSIRLPFMLPSYAMFFVLLLAMMMYPSYPAIGVALLICVIILYFKRNVNVVSAASGRTPAVYGEEIIPRIAVADAGPYASEHSGPREYARFAETYEGFTNASAPVVDTEPVPEGSYPIDARRPLVAPSVNFTANYRPSEDMGSNEFVRSGPNIDQKMTAFAQYT